MDPSDLAVPAGLDCAACGDAVEQGYAPVVDGAVDGGEAVCAVCGWGEVGMNGCAPEVRDFGDGADAVARLAPETGGDGLVVDAVTVER